MTYRRALFAVRDARGKYLSRQFRWFDKPGPLMLWARSGDAWNALARAQGDPAHPGLYVERIEATFEVAA